MRLHVLYTGDYFKSLATISEKVPEQPINGTLWIDSTE